MRCGAPRVAAGRVCGQCGELFPATVVRASASPIADAATSDLVVGEVLKSSWRLEEIVGRGGMGAVFRARDLELGRDVAVKALSSQLAEEEFVSRFEREARVLGNLDHPNIVTLYGVGRHRGVPYIVMKFLQGQPLRQWVEERGGRLHAQDLLLVARPLCSALSYTHQMGVVHRDLKPSNIMVSPTGHLTVFDLGIARSHDSTLTKTGVIFGTPGYMAPELIVGEKNLDGRLDLYALGVILYELLTGQAPFSESHEDSLLRAHLMKPRPDPCLLRSDLPPEVGAVVQRAMAIEPKDRFPDADELLAALETALGVRKFHEAATIRRTPLSRGSGPRPVFDDPDVTPKMVAPQQPAPRAPSKEEPPTAPQAPVVSPDATVVGPAPKAAPGQSARNATGDDLMLVERWWERRKVQVASAGGAGLFLVVALAVAFLLPSEVKPPAPTPIVTLRPTDVPPPPPPTDPTSQAAPQDVEARKKAFYEKEKSVDVQRVRRVKPRVQRKTASYLGVRGRKTHGELQIHVTVNGEPVPAWVSVDKDPPGHAPLYVPVKAGKHTVRVTYESFPPSKFTTSVAVNRSVRLEVELQPYDDAPSDPNVAVSVEEENPETAQAN